MGYDEIADKMAKESGVEQSTMMKSPCPRCKGDFMAMMFQKEDYLIIKVPPARVDALIDAGDGREMNFTKKKFKEWVLIPREFEDKFEAYIREALDYAETKNKTEIGKQYLFNLGIIGLGARGQTPRQLGSRQIGCRRLYRGGHTHAVEGCGICHLAGYPCRGQSGRHIRRCRRHRRRRTCGLSCVGRRTGPGRWQTGSGDQAAGDHEGGCGSRSIQSRRKRRIGGDGL